MCALALNSGGGGNTRFSRSVESISWLAARATGNEDMQNPFGKRYLRGARHAKGRRRPKDASWMSLYRYRRTLGKLYRAEDRDRMMGRDQLWTAVRLRRGTIA